MKKILMAMLCALMLTGCTNVDTEDDTENVTEYETQDGEEILNDSEMMLSISVEKIPFDNIRYNNESFSLKSLSAYVGDSESGHGYHPYVVAEFDLSTLSEDAYYWMMKDWGENNHLGTYGEITQTFGVTSHIDSEQNNLFNESLEKLSSWIDGKTVYYIFYLPDEYKNDFSDMELSFGVNITQDETYERKNDEGETVTGNKAYDYNWFSINAEYSDLEISIMSVNDMPDNVKQVLAESGMASNAVFDTDGDISETTKNETTTGQFNALASAWLYLETMPFSYAGLIEQLEYEGYSTEDATYAADNCGADWNEQAVKSAKSYLDSMPFSREELISQLEYEGFTNEQAVYGVEQNGY